MEPTEVDEFVKQVQEGGEEGMRHISLAISVLAVLVAMVTVMGHRTHTEAVLTQTRAADQWNLYQAKKIRLEQTNVAIDLLSLQPSSNDSAVQKKLAEYQAHVTKWKGELDGEQEKAKDLEIEVGKAERRADRYDLGEALLQIAVVLSSITLLTRQRAYFMLGLTLGLAGLIMAASALLVR
jgi:hypothetical protein